MARYFENIGEIQEILSSGNFERLVGAFENEIFEAKADPWQLEHDLEKFKFARDVTAMANSRGGIIAAGIVARRLRSRRRDEVLEKQRYLPESLSAADRYMHVLVDWVYPVPEGIDVRWHRYARDTTRGVIGIHVPKQKDELRPFLVKKYFEESGKRLGTAICIVHRFGAMLKDSPYQEVYSLLREGRRADIINQKLDTIIAKLGARS
jgi:hypothetical protein